MPLDYLQQIGVSLGARARNVPHVGVLGDDFQQDPLTLAANHYRWMRLLQRLGTAARVGPVVVTSVQGHFFLLEHPLDDLQRLVERLQPPGNCFEVDTETAMLELEPSRAETQVEAPVADVVECRRHFRRDAWIAVSVAIDHRADARAFGLLAERGERGPSFEAWAGRVGNANWLKEI